MTEPSIRSLSRTTWLLLGACAALAAARVATVERPLGHNDRSRWLTVRALVENGSYAVGSRLRSRASGKLLDVGLIGEIGWGSVDVVLHPQRQRFYSSKSTLLPTIVAGGYWVLHRVFGLTLAGDTATVLRILLFVVNFIPLLAYLLLVALMTQRYCRDPSARALVLLCAGLCTFVPTFVVTLTNHLQASVGAMAALYLALRIRVDGAREPWRFALCGLAAGWTVANELPAACFAAALLMLLLCRGDGAQRPAGFVLGAVIPQVAQALTTMAALGQVEPVHGFHGAWYRYRGSYWNAPLLLDARHPSKPTYLFHMIVGHHGLLSLTPLWLLSLAGHAGDRSPAELWARAQRLRPWARALPYLAIAWVTWDWAISLTLWRSALAFVVLCACLGALVWPRPDDPEQPHAPFRRVTLACLVMMLSFYGRTTHNYGGSTVGPRWLMWLTPLLLHAMLPAVERLTRTLGGRLVVAALAALSAVGANASNNPWAMPYLYRLFG